jgi:anhydro-N-acetylmuramic acid kinase
LIDAFTKLHFPDKNYDKDAEIAKQGRINQPLLKALKTNKFFQESYPKTTGPELFNIEYVRKAQKESDSESISVPDLLATLTRFTAETIAEAINKTLKNTKYNIDTFTIYLSGGGTHNPLLISWLKEFLPCNFLNTDAIGIDGDAKEAVLFAVLANETVAGGETNFGSRQGVPSVSLGKISLPN